MENLNVTKEGIEVTAGQVWRDLDPRRNRYCKVLEVSEGVATIIQCESDGTQKAKGYKRTIKVARMYRCSNGWAQHVESSKEAEATTPASVLSGYRCFDELLYGHAAFLRQAARCRIVDSGWVVGERFNDQFDTEVGGFVTNSAIHYELEAQRKESLKPHTISRDCRTRCASVIVDYKNGGRVVYTEAEAKKMPSLKDVLARLQARNAEYEQHLAAVLNPAKDALAA